jgi:hypothetical protein
MQREGGKSERGGERGSYREERGVEQPEMEGSKERAGLLSQLFIEILRNSNANRKIARQVSYWPRCLLAINRNLS